MRQATRGIAIGVLFVVALSAVASPRMLIPKGTPATLVFDQALNSKKARVGQSVRLHIQHSVVIGRQTILRQGEAVTGVIDAVQRRKSYGIDAKLRIALNPVQTLGGVIPLQPRTKGGFIGEKTGQAAGATAGGALVLGPVGLVGGYFVHGKNVSIKPGDRLETEVSQNVSLRTDRSK